MKIVKIDKISVTLCHYPMTVWYRSHFNSWHLHGHLHDNTNINTEYRAEHQCGKVLNVNVEFNNYEFWSEDDIRRHMYKAPDNFDLIRKEEIVFDEDI